MAVFPVWKDTYVSLPASSSYIDYVLSKSNNSIFYSGKAYKLPNETAINVYINKIVQSLLVSNIDFTKKNQWQKDVDASLDFNFVPQGSSSSNHFTWMDYSYEDKAITATMGLNNPVNGVIDINGIAIFSIVNTSANGSSVVITGKNGTKYSGAVAGGRGVYHYVCDASTLGEGPVTFTVGGVTYKWEVKTTCQPYELVYKNLNGGYDVFVIEGNNVQTDTWVGYNINRSFDNQTLEFEQEKYLLDLQESWKLYTGLLTDYSSKNIGNVFKSTKLFLYELSSDKITPVYITNTKAEYRTYKNNGYMPVSYSIDIKASQSKAIR